MWAWVAIVAYLLLAPHLAWFLIRRQQGAVRLMATLVLSGLAAGMPLLLPTEQHFARFCVSLVALINFVRIWMAAYGRNHDARMWETYPRFVLWMHACGDSIWPEDGHARRANRRAGMRRIARAVPKIAVAMLLIGLNTVVPLHENLWISTFWMLWMSYFCLSGGIDLGTGAFMLTGLGIAEVFDAPPLARSPRDFWSRRWNMWFRGLCHRNIFLRLGGAHRPIVGASAVFVFSAITHEYLVVASLSTTTGAMGAFFLIHGVATIGTVWFTQKIGRRTLMALPVAIGLHIVWMTLTGPLFFLHFDQATHLRHWTLW
jgi:hypothetical protein